MKLEVEILIQIDEDSRNIDVELKGNDMGVLIGKRGQTLDSLQLLAMQFIKILKHIIKLRSIQRTIVSEEKKH